MIKTIVNTTAVEAQVDWQGSQMLLGGEGETGTGISHLSQEASTEEGERESERSIAYWRNQKHFMWSSGREVVREKAKQRILSSLMKD